MYWVSLESLQRLLRWSAPALIGFYAVVAQAQDTRVSLPSPGELGSLFVQNSEPLTSAPGSLIHGTLTMGATQFLGGVQAERQSFLPSFLLDLRALKRGALFEAGGKVQSQIFAASSIPYYLELPEAFVGTSRDLSQLQFFLGRKQENWNRLDEFWKLGFWQPRFRWDYLEPQSVGLTGAFLKLSLPWVNLTGFGSPVFLPERGAPIFFSQGTVNSPGPYFTAPSNSVRYLNVDTPVRYDLRMPPLSEVIFKPSVSVQARFGQNLSERTGPWGAVSYAYKPINQVIMGSQGSMLLDEDAQPYIPATLYPRFLYHHLTSLEGGMDTEWTSMWISFLDERPIADQPDPTWKTVQNVAPGTTMSATVEWKIGKWFDDEARLGLSYLRQWGGNAPDSGGLTGATSFFEARYPFQNAISLGLRSPMWSDRLGFSSRLIYDFTLQGMALTAEAQYDTRNRIQFRLGADIIGSALSENSPGFGGDFFSKFRGNNRVRFGVSYVF